MAIYFFNFRQGAGYQADDVGSEFASVEDAYLGAFSAAQDMWHELLVQRQDPLLCTFEVTDERGLDLFMLPFEEILDVCRGRGRPQVRPSHQPHFVAETIEIRRQALRALDEVSATVASTRTTLRETWSLLSQVDKMIKVP